MEAAESGARKRCGTELRAYRVARGWTQVELGNEIGYSGSFVSDVERGERGIGEDFAKCCDETFKTPGTFMRLWEDLQREAFPVWFAAVVPIEREADKITGWETTAVPGLLQTEHYARSVVRARSPRHSDEAIERTVQARMERQAILSGAKPPLCCYVLAEAVLRHVIGGHDVMAEQLEKLVKAAEAPGFLIQVLPYTAHDHPGVEGPITIYERLGLPLVAYCETFGGGRMIEDQTEVSDLATVVGALRAAALPPRDSVALMRAIRRDLD